MERMFIVVLAIMVCHLSVSGGKQLSYRKEGKYMIGAIIPLTQDGPNGNCSKVNPAGVTIAEALVYAFDDIQTENEFDSLNQATTIGYDIRDNCGNAQRTREHVLNITTESMQYKQKKSTTVPNQVVISEFARKDIPSLNVLNAEDIIQVSYSPDNARLNKLQGQEYPIKKLISVYPAYSKKILAVVDIIDQFQFGYVFGLANNNVEGSDAMNTLKTKLDKKKVCMTSLLVSNVGQVSGLVGQIAENKKIKVVIVHASKDIELALYKEADSRNLTNLIFITTQNWESDMASLKKTPAVVDGMLDVYYKRDSKGFVKYMRDRDLPYKGRKWIQDLFKNLGGDAKCLDISTLDMKACAAKRNEVRQAMTGNAPAAEYAYQSVVAIAAALQKAKKEKKPLLEAIKGLTIDNQLLSVVFNNDLSSERSKFAIDQIRIDAQDGLKNKWLGVWNEIVHVGDSLNFRKNDIVWKKGSKKTPMSVCSDSCPAGWERAFLDDAKCCWDCTKCPNGTASNITNADSCNTCPAGTVVKPKQDGCKAYKLLYFEWFGGVGALCIILMVITVCLILFALGVFSQNSAHELVINANYNSLCLFLLALLVLVFTPIPLLINTPTVSSCCAYIIMFNVAISVVIGILNSRSAAVNSLFDEETGELSKGSLGRFPRTLVVLLVVVIQVIITVVAYKLEELQTMHNHTDQWDHRYHECSSWASTTFWAGFTFNVVASVVGNSLSCSSVKMEENCYELKYVLISHLMFYMFGIVELVIFFRTNDQHLAGGQAINCVLFALAFYFAYIWPKIYAILFRSKGDKCIREPSVDSDEDGALMTTAIHASAGFKNQGIVQMTVRDAV